MKVVRLTAGDSTQARTLFSLMASVFGEPCDVLGDSYLDRLLARADFWAMAAFSGDEIVGGITAHTLPMTRTESAELFIYDLAVRADYQRQGVGRRLVSSLRAQAAAQGIGDVFVPVDNDDADAIEFYRAAGGTATPVTFFVFTTR